jgi:hypothetical protein
LFVEDNRAGFSTMAGLRSSTFFPVLDTIDALDERTDVPDELRLSMAGGLNNFEASAPGVCARLALAVEDNVDVRDVVDGRRGRLIFGVPGFAPTLDSVDAPDVLRESVE